MRFNKDKEPFKTHTQLKIGVSFHLVENMHFAKTFFRVRKTYYIHLCLTSHPNSRDTFFRFITYSKIHNLLGLPILRKQTPHHDPHVEWGNDTETKRREGVE